MSSRNPVRVSFKELVALKEKARHLTAFETKKQTTRQTGEMRSPFKTRGLDFQELRPYQPGDDIRQIDWRATAKYGKPFTKLYTEEKERPVFFLCDLRTRMKFASSGDFKSVMVARITALLAWLSFGRKDPVGYALLLPQLITTSFPSKGEAALLSLLKALATEASLDDTRPSDETTLAEALRLIQTDMKRGTLLFILSDFDDLTPEASLLLSRAADEHTVALVHLYDLLEKELPAGLLPVSDGHERATLNMSAQNRRIFAREFEQKITRLKQLADTHDLGLLSFATHESYLTDMMRLFERGGFL